MIQLWQCMACKRQWRAEDEPELCDCGGKDVKPVAEIEPQTLLTRLGVKVRDRTQDG